MEANESRQDNIHAALDILRNPALPADDKLRMVFRERELLDDRICWPWAVWCVREAKPFFFSDEASRALFDVVECWSRGEASKEELRTAYVAARKIPLTHKYVDCANGRSAVFALAAHNAYDATGEAARAAGYWATYYHLIDWDDEYYETEFDAAYDGGYQEAREAQVARLIKMVEKGIAL